MAKTPNIDPEQLKNDAIQIGNAVAGQAKTVASKAADVANQGIEWAAPHAQQAVDSVKDRAIPIVSGTSDKARDVIDRTLPAIENAQDKVRSDYIPRISQAFNDAVTSGKTDADLPEGIKLARDASDAVRKPKRVRKFLGLTALGVSAASVAYLLWRRSQPIEDPWAEEYWADIDDSDYDLPDFDTESIDDDIDSASSKVEDAVDELTEEAGPLSD